MNTQIKLIIDRILSTVAEQKASDLHFSVGSKPIIRMNDKLITLDNEVLITKDFMEDFVSGLLNEDQTRMLHDQKELILAYQFQKEAKFRINIFYQKGVLAAYFRLIGDKIRPLNELGLPPAIEGMANSQSGLLVISGTFGSGKTTTAASIIDYINHNKSQYILTIEKPIEYNYKNIKSVIEQREVGRDTTSFEQALNTITQEDVDVLFLSEMQNKDVIMQALTIAASGRFVIANVEADTVIKTLELLIYSFPSNEQQQIREKLAVTMRGIICQRLVPKIGGGRVAIATIMTSTPPIQSIIKEGSLYQINNIIQTSRDEGMVSLDWSLAELVKTNQVLMEDALKNSTDPQQVQYMLRT